MTQDKQTQILKEAISNFGFDAQLRMLIEECAELIVASSHFVRGRHGAKDNFLEELVDVEIMINQMFIALEDDTDLLNKWKTIKLQRLHDRTIKFKRNLILINHGDN